MAAELEAIEATRAAARAAASKKAASVVALDVSERIVLTDVFLVASADNERQVRAIVDAIDEEMHKRGMKTLRQEGVLEGRWALLDYGSVVVHVQHEEDREFYALERLWSDCPAIELDLEGVEVEADPLDLDAYLYGGANQG
ncbi:ribosome silencing factor [Buchananella felis]|uniref:ribosome silencing factor n=1 Tax=Buchananella felis TaxID=3231492 RepID=UPI003528F347